MSDIEITRYSEAEVPTEYGTFRVVVYREDDCQAKAGAISGVERSVGCEHLAIVKGDIAGKADVLARVHSECLTGEVLRSLKCDCREQLDLAMRRIAEAEQGVVIYLRQEGRGIGLGNKIRAYALQEKGFDTVDANTELGFDPDMRRYHVASAMIADLGISSVALMTNNPLKVEALRADGVTVSRRVEHQATPHEVNRAYLETKRSRMGHALDPIDKPDEPRRSTPLELLRPHVARR